MIQKKIAIAKSVSWSGGKEIKSFVRTAQDDKPNDFRPRLSIIIPVTNYETSLQRRFLDLGEYVQAAAAGPLRVPEYTGPHHPACV